MMEVLARVVVEGTLCFSSVNYTLGVICSCGLYHAVGMNCCVILVYP